MADIARLDSAAPDFDARLGAMLRAEPQWDAALESRVREIVARVRDGGDAALVALTAELDGWRPDSPRDLAVEPARLDAAHARIGDEARDALDAAAARIRSFHERQVESSWRIRDAGGTVLGQQITPLDRVGVYVPGGKAAYPSTVLMNVLPAKVAGVGEIVMVVPAPHAEVDEHVLAAARVAGVDRVFLLGGAQAVAALAHGTESVPAVDKIVGPGNRYVAMAKRLVFGTVGIDMIAGPSEIVVLCDGRSRPDWIAMDLFSQAEHDEDARAVLLCPDAGFVEAVAGEIDRLLPAMERSGVIRASLAARGALVTVRDLAEGVAIANRLAPEHLELSVEDPEALLPAVRHAGAIFLGRHTAEAVGDYCAGPNHVLPTAGTARFSSPLGAYDFQKRSSIIGCSPASAAELGRVAAVLARAERLTAHARSAELRYAEDDGV